MPAGNFDDELTILKSGHEIKAEGPIDTEKHDVLEMCVWVVQRAALAGDVVANAMGEPLRNEAPPSDAMGSMPAGGGDDMGRPVVGKPKNRWSFELPLEHGENGVTFVQGPAQAIAIVVIREKVNGTGMTPGDQGVLLWSQSVVLKDDGPVAAV